MGGFPSALVYTKTNEECGCSQRVFTHLWLLWFFFHPLRGLILSCIAWVQPWDILTGKSLYMKEERLLNRNRGLFSDSTPLLHLSGKKGISCLHWLPVLNSQSRGIFSTGIIPHRHFWRQPQLLPSKAEKEGNMSMSEEKICILSPKP